MNSLDVMGVGRAVMDYAVLVPKYPEADQKTEALDRYYGSGSPVPNALCQLSSWGWKTALAAVVGDDREGDDFIRDLTSCSVETAFVTRKTGQSTPRAFIWVEAGSGKRTVVLDRALAPLSAGDLPFESLQPSRFLLADGYETNANLAAMKAVREGGGEVMLDVGAVREQMDEQFALCDWIIASLAFAKERYGSLDLFQVVRELLAFGAKGAVVTNGAGGCVAAWEQQVEWFRSYRVETVDTTGAGDIYHAGFLHGLLNGWSVPSSVRWASAAAALSTTSLGGRGKLPNEGEVRDLLVREGEPWDGKPENMWK
jgi:sulfofructose kinase